jgi:hypothetical protein
MVEELQYAINVQRFEEQRADEIRSQQQRDCCDTLPRYYSMAFAVLALPGEFEQYRVKSFLRSNALL